MKKAKILLIEDSLTQAVLIQSVLEDGGYDVTCASSGEDALLTLQKGLPDLVVTDCHLPGMQGPDLCRKLRLNVATQDIPIIMLTANQSTEVELMGLDSGADDHVVKTDDMANLLIRANALLKRSGRRNYDSARFEEDLRKTHILLVDDSQAYLSFVTAALEREGLVVRTAKDGKAALAVCEGEQIDCVLTNMDLPGMSGFDLCRELASRRAKGTIDPVLVVVSDSEDPGNLVRALDSGADDFIAKSSDVQVLLAQSRSLLRSKFLADHKKKIASELEAKEREADIAKVRQAEAEKRASMAEDLRQANEELQRKEAELRDALEAAKAASESKSAFLATMSHEIRTPMNGVVGMIDLLVETELTEDQRDMTNTIRNSAFSLLRIIDDILDFSKIEAGKMHIEEVPVSIRDTVESVVETVAANAEQRDVDLLSFIDPDIPDLVMADAGRVRQILFNLAGNAIKFTNNEDGRKGRVIVRADRVDDGSTDTATVRYEVQDNGIGISEEGRARLFQAFSQAEESTTRRFGGTGLGLAICSRLATMMGGEIGCDSVEGEGSTFHFQVTYRPADDTRTGRDVSVLQDLSGLRILLAEADDNRRAFLHRYLTHWRAEVVDAEDEAAFSALSDAAAGAPFDIVVLGTGWDMDGKRDIRDGLRDRPGFTEARYVLLKRGRSVFEQIDGDDTVVFGATPLTRSGFIRAVAIAAGRASPEIQHQEETETMERVTAPTVEEAEAQGRLILLAEDNEINQKVITRQLDLLGYAALVANDGQEALETWRSRRFGMVLTDCHMPEMDGYELTRSIRAEETDGRIPILAITANALQGESDRCLSVGMDDYLSKPVELAKLKTMLAKWMPAAGAAPAAAPAPEPVAAGMAPIDPKALTALVGDDPEMCRQLLADFVEPSWRYIGEVKEGVRSASAISVAQAAHKLKSSSRAVGANELADLCLQLEAAGKAGDWEGIGAAAPRLDGLMQDVEAYVARQ